jgi:hypothetical protein
MTTDRRSFLTQTAIALGLAAAPGPLKAVARAVSARWVPSILRVSTPALRTGWPSIARITLQVARANAARGIAGAGLAAAAALKALAKTTGHRWYDPVFRPSLRSPVTGQVR